MGTLETNIHRDVPLMVQENKGKWNQGGEERLYNDYRFVRAGKDVLGFLALLLVLLPWLWQVTDHPVQKTRSGHGNSPLNSK